MHIDYEVTVADLTMFNQYLIKNKHPNIVIKGIVLYFYLFGSIAYIFLSFIEKDPMAPIVLGAIVGIIGASFTKSILINNVFKHIQSTYENHKDISLGPMAMDISSLGISNSFWAGNSKVIWEGVQKAVYIQAYCYLFVGIDKAYIIPRKSVVDINGFQNEIAEYLSKEKIFGSWNPPA